MSKVRRHTVAVRLTHAAVALSGIVLLFSGFGAMPMYARYNLVKLPGLAWAGDFEVQLVIHYLGAAVFCAAVAFHLAYHWRRREFDAWPKRGDLRASWDIVKAILGGKEEPPHGKFLAEQRLAYFGIGVTALVLAATGLLKSYKNLGVITLDSTLLQATTLIHTAATMVFALLVVAHLAAFGLRANRPLLPSMLTGTVPRDYAEKRHPLWKTDER